MLRETIMPALETLVGAACIGALVLYALFGGADFGGGVWDLLAWGPRAKRQRALIESAIGPIWEANHVWLILVVVVLFTGFPAAFAALGIALHVPLTLLLLGIVMRGAAFTFRAYEDRGVAAQRGWGVLFSIASVVAPLLLGTIVGALASGDLRLVNGVPAHGFLSPWTQPFPLTVGVFALALFALLAAVYLTAEADEEDLREDFRLRALITSAVVGALALVVFLLAETGAPLVRSGLTNRAWALPLHATTALAGITLVIALLNRRTLFARIAAAAQVALIVLGWAASQFPYLIVPDVTLTSAAAPPATLRLLLGALVVGSLVLWPSLFLLFRIFKAHKTSV